MLEDGCDFFFYKMFVLGNFFWDYTLPVDQKYVIKAWGRFMKKLVYIHYTVQSGDGGVWSSPKAPACV